MYFFRGGHQIDLPPHKKYISDVCFELIAKGAEKGLGHKGLADFWITALSGPMNIYARTLHGCSEPNGEPVWTAIHTRHAQICT